MFKFFYIIFINLWRAPYMFPRMHRYIKRNDKYSDEQRYKLVQKLVRIIKRGLRIKTKAYGIENLPKEGGYIMYPNHQGKYDALGIFNTHEKPCTFVVEEEVSYWPLVNEVLELLHGKRLNRDVPRKAVKVMNEIMEETKKGKRYIIFPEGYYDNNKNSINEFKAGSFKCAVRARVPIVPVALIDSYKAFKGFTILRSTRTKVYYLEPITYEVYKDMKTTEIRDLVVERISNCIKEHL